MPVLENTTKDELDVVLLGGCYELKQLNFELDKATILPTSYSELDGLAAYLKKYPFLTIYLDGYTDKTGDSIALTLNSPNLILPEPITARVVYSNVDGYSGIEFQNLKKDAESLIVNCVHQFTS